MTNHHAQQHTLFSHAKQLGRISIWLGIAAIGVFCVFGTLASMASFHQSTVVYWMFYAVPYVLVALSVPISLYQAFLLYRYRVIDPKILMMVLMAGMGLVLMALGFWWMEQDISATMTLFLAMIAWFAMPFLFGVNITRYLQFLQQFLQQGKHDEPYS